MFNVLPQTAENTYVLLFCSCNRKTPRPEKEEDHMKANKIFNQTTITTVTTVREQVFPSGGLA